MIPSIIVIASANGMNFIFIAVFLERIGNLNDFASNLSNSLLSFLETICTSSYLQYINILALLALLRD